eukprot:CAMPEP_0174361188 /NCGR_PEP_ID=MMETSP0811_2-20130205/58002_1 /TAXON_ID=73025 ORGANISM="Eutreptiella gymnastica-like, Strain CCMP1594" /NCGR_SAMPLE_ID=MMETSP0811_2 /ASSEMBLY_ACC=CAM_ASM_000667 /LENGTH=45 /DNA_ID= /DNA_START= /DNA_END= /DNA_ORIENTATION=
MDSMDTLYAGLQVAYVDYEMQIGTGGKRHGDSGGCRMASIKGSGA